MIIYKDQSTPNDVTMASADEGIMPLAESSTESNASDPNSQSGSMMYQPTYDDPSKVASIIIQSSRVLAKEFIEDQTKTGIEFYKDKVVAPIFREPEDDETTLEPGITPTAEPSTGSNIGTEEESTKIRAPLAVTNHYVDSIKFAEFE